MVFNRRHAMALQLENIEHFDSKSVMDEERFFLRLNESEKVLGLALSGGGIRSASFGLGVLQALLEHGILQSVDYLSTVSGGGYIGSALSWFRKHHHGKAQDGSGQGKFFDATNPFGIKGEGVRTGTDVNGETGVEGEQVEGISDEHKNTFLDFLRQHGNYLSPCDHLTFLSAVGVLIRNLILSFAVYFSILMIAFSLLMSLAYGVGQVSLYKQLVVKPLSGWEKNETVPDKYIRIDMPEEPGECSVSYRQTGTSKKKSWGKRSLFHFSILVAAFFAMLFILAGILFSIITWRAPSRDARAGENCSSYICRNFFQKAGGWLLKAFFLFTIIATVPVVDVLVSERIGAVGVVGYLSGVWAALAKVRRSMGRESVFKAAWIGDRLFEFGAMVFLYSALVAAFHLNIFVGIPAEAGDLINLDPFLTLLLIAVGTAFLGYFVNINYASLGRMYRDRLMESFLPDTQAIENNQWKQATEADRTLLNKLCKDEKGKVLKPYHLINANVILGNARREKYRGRGGDSFIMTPKFCGSDATGYVRTKYFMRKSKNKGGITLATAMAVSGAAANPHTGVAGQGPTRGPLVSMLMTVFNLRLGCWFSNPRMDAPYRALNYFRPGLGSLLNMGYRENSGYIEVTDGGHFENLGLYELIRRRVDTIIVSDAAADKDFNFGDLANAIERVRTDFGVSIRFKNEDEELGALVPGSLEKNAFSEKFKLAERGYAKGTIKYPCNGNPSKMGTIYLIKSTLVPGLPADIYGYKARHHTFPDQTTADQFFDENQFEAYRELGYRATDAMCLSYGKDLFGPGVENETGIVLDA